MRRVGSAPSPGQRLCSHHWCPPSAWREEQIYRDRWRGTSTWDIANIDGHWGREGFWGGEPTATSLLPFSSANTSATERILSVKIPGSEPGVAAALEELQSASEVRDRKLTGAEV